MDTAAPRLQDNSGGQGLVVLEATHFNRNTAAGGSSWQSVVADSPDGTAMQALPNAGRNVQANISLSPLMEYKATFVTNGTHYIWAYGEADSPPGAGLDDTCNIGLDGVLPSTGVGVGGSFFVLQGFLWNNAQGGGGPIATLNVATTGEHVVDVWMQKDGLQINKVLLTTDINYDPNAASPTESILNPAQPRLTVQNTSAGLVITWSGGGTLWSAPTLTGVWSPVAGASGSINIDPSAPRQFYKVIR
jgi:Gylcosyl hydrolase family 115 C-terminal domain